MSPVPPTPAPRARLIVQRYPCTACVIINGLSMESLEKVALRRPGFTYEIVEVGDPSDLADVPGLEVEKLPALILDGVQRTAGSILAPRQLDRMLDEADAETL